MVQTTTQEQTEKKSPVLHAMRTETREAIVQTNVVSVMHWWTLASRTADHFMLMAQTRGWDVFAPQPLNSEAPTIPGRSIYANYRQFLSNNDGPACLNYIHNVRLTHMGVHGFKDTVDYSLIMHLLAAANQLGIGKEVVEEDPPFCVRTLTRGGYPSCRACHGFGLNTKHKPCKPCADRREATEKSVHKNETISWRKPTDKDKIESGHFVRLAGAVTPYRVKGWTACGQISLVPSGASYALIVDPGDICMVQETVTVYTNGAD